VAEVAKQEELYTTWEVARIARVSRRQLQYWAERGILNPHIEGHRRTYTATELREAERIGELRRAGASFADIRKILKQGWTWERLVRVDKPMMWGGTLLVRG
jgi:hypothetical protein